jgi:hypothetical protein
MGFVLLDDVCDDFKVFMGMYGDSASRDPTDRHFAIGVAARGHTGAKINGQIQWYSSVCKYNMHVQYTD